MKPAYIIIGVSVHASGKPHVFPVEDRDGIPAPADRRPLLFDLRADAMRRIGAFREKGESGFTMMPVRVPGNVASRIREYGDWLDE